MKTKSKFFMPSLLIMAVAFQMFQLGCNKDDQGKVQIPSVKTVAVSNITATYAVCEGKVSSGGGAEWVNPGICWSDIIAEPTSVDKKNTASGGAQTGSYSVVIDHLTPGTIYYFRAFASNNAGFGYGDVISFNTGGSVVGEIAYNQELNYGSLNDIDGNSYKTIAIGNQTWMAENLKTTKFSDGGTIAQKTDLAEWISLSTPAYCYFLNDEAKYKGTYGTLYNWHTVNTGKLCPSGWHVPTSNDWGFLTASLGGAAVAGGKLMEAGTTHWITQNLPVSNSSGFTALPGGMRQGTYDSLQASYFEDLGYTGYFWSSNDVTEPGDDFNNGIGMRITGGWDQWSFPKTAGQSVRCIKD
jgi:uncharacterized protein (TIGR02145 family)